MIKNHKEITAATEACQIFAQQFGKNDIYSQMILEILLEELLKYKHNTKIVEEK